MDDDELVQVAVPRRHLMTIYGVLARLESEGPNDADNPEEEAGTPDDTVAKRPWTVEDLRRFATTPTATSVTIVKVLQALAKQPDVLMTTTELEQATGVPRNNLKGAFSAMTRHLKKHYPGLGWGGALGIITFIWGPSMGPDFPAEGHYKLTAEQAAFWAEAAPTS